jgi:hypothetical protein
MVMLEERFQSIIPADHISVSSGKCRACFHLAIQIWKVCNFMKLGNRRRIYFDLMEVFNSTLCTIKEGEAIGTLLVHRTTGI